MHPVFIVYKNETESRVIYDINLLSEFERYEPLNFKLPSFNQVLSDYHSDEFAIKLGLQNVFYHVLITPNGRRYFGIKCDRKVFVSKNSRWGSGVPHL